MHRFIATTRSRSTKLLLPKRLTTLHQQQQHNHYSNYYNNRDNNNNSSSDLRNRETNDEQHDRRNNHRSGAYRFFTGLSALTGLSFFSYLLYLNMYKDQHFNDSLTRNNTRSSPTSLVDDHPDFSSDHSSSLYNSVENEQLNQMKQFIWHVLRDNRDVIAVINQDNKTRIKQQQQQRQQQQMNRGVGVVGGDDDDDAGEESTMERMAMLNQSDRNRDIDIMHVNAQSYQQRYQSHVSELFKLMNSIENTSRMRVLKKTNENRPLILLVDNVNAADNNVLDVLKVYARRWSRDPERFGVGIVFAGHTLRYRFKDDAGAKIWDFGTDQSNYLTGGGSGGGVSSLNENVVDPRDVAAGNYQTEGGYRDL